MNLKRWLYGFAAFLLLQGSGLFLLMSYTIHRAMTRGSGVATIDFNSINEGWMEFALMGLLGLSSFAVGIVILVRELRSEEDE